MGYFKAEDTINGQEGKAQVTINGKVEDMFYAKNIEATFEKNKEELKLLGKRGVSTKTAGWSGKGSMTIYYVTSLFRKMAMDYIKKGKDTYFELLITNEDPASGVGRQSIVLHNCNFDSVVMAKIDVESAAMEEDIDFTFDDVDIIEEFTSLA